MQELADHTLEERVLVLAPTVQDAEASRRVLATAGIMCLLCQNLEEVCSEMEKGAGAALLTQESILDDRNRCLESALKKQPLWSDFPLVVLTPAGDSATTKDVALRAVGHITLMKRPVPIAELVSTLESALRDRIRQYETRTLLAERERQAEALLETDRRKDEFLAMLAHELRNPLAAVNNAVTVLKMSSDAENRNWAGDVVERQVKQLSRLIDDLLDVSRITSGKIRLRRESLDAGPVLDQAVESARPLLEERKHQLSVSIDRGHLPLQADPTRLEQIVVNLLTNAAKYTPLAGRIELTGRREADHVIIAVRDNGIGILPEKLPVMFQLFAQGERSIARSEGGLGIGLTLVKKLVELHDGSVTARSEGPGTGSEFTVRLPASSPPRPDPSAPGPTPNAAAKGARILVVDDNLDTARGMVRLLKLLGNDVRSAHDGPAAVALARSFQPGFVLLDIGLPGMDGYEVAERLKADECCKDTVIIGVSGYGQDEDRRRSRAAGFDHHLVKPVDFDALAGLLR